MGDTTGKYDGGCTEGDNGASSGTEDVEIWSKSEIELELQRQLSQTSLNRQLLYYTMILLKNTWHLETLPDGSDAESIVQDTILKLLSGDNKWPRDVGLSTFLHKNLYRDIPRAIKKAIKANGVPVSESLDEIEHDNFVDKLHFDNHGHKKILSEQNSESTHTKFDAISAAVRRKLRPDEKRVFDSWNSPIKETSSRLGIPWNKVRNIRKRVRRAVERVKKELEQ
jgi:DNA-directed RNA polymerase specialized sigma24 family protein